jgi:hypothetical protein
MIIDLTQPELEMLLTSLQYSHRAVAEAQSTPNEVRRQNLDLIESVIEKVRQARNRGHI